MLIEIIIGISSFFGGMLGTAIGLYTVNRIREERDMRRRTQLLYEDLINNRE